MGRLKPNDSLGREQNDPKPLVISFEREETIEDRIKRIIRIDASRRAAEAGLETWEEANDFDVLDDFEVPEMDSKYTIVQEEYLGEAPKEPQGVSKKPLEADEEPPEPVQEGSE